MCGSTVLFTNVLPDVYIRCKFRGGVYRLFRYFICRSLNRRNNVAARAAFNARNNNHYTRAGRWGRDNSSGNFYSCYWIPISLPILAGRFWLHVSSSIRNRSTYGRHWVTWKCLRSAYCGIWMQCSSCYGITLFGARQ